MSERMSKKVATSAEDKTCLNPKCKTVISEEGRNQYGRHGNRWTCCQMCDDIVDPVSAAIRRRLSGRSTPTVEEIDWDRLVEQV